ncbi:hypothetical protein pb186bvf_019309 [Paramecium bursaria]
MKIIKSSLNNIKDYVHDYRKVRYTKKALQLYEQGKYDKIISGLDSYYTYRLIEVNNHPFIFYLMSEKNNKMIEQLLDLKFKNKILEDDNNPNKFYPLTFSVLNQLNEINDILIKKGANLQCKHQEENNLIHMCSFYGKFEPLDWLAKEGININEQNMDGNTPLHLASIKNHVEVIKKLINLKASPHIINKQNYLPIHEAVYFGSEDAYQLLKQSYDPNKKNQKEHIVHLASMLDNDRILNDIIQNNSALINFRDQENNAAPIHYAVINESIECVKYLAVKGALINIRDKIGNTPLHYAVQAKNLDIIKILCQYKSDISVQNNDNISPLDMAISDRDKIIVNIFKSITENTKYFIK